MKAAEFLSCSPQQWTEPVSQKLMQEQIETIQTNAFHQQTQALQI